MGETIHSVSREPSLHRFNSFFSLADAVQSIHGNHTMIPSANVLGEPPNPKRVLFSSFFLCSNGESGRLYENKLAAGPARGPILPSLSLY